MSCRRTNAGRPGASHAVGGLLGGLVTAVVTAGLLLAGAAPAQAHNRLSSTDPADGSTVATAPAQLVLTFDEPAIALGTEVVVTGPDGAVVSQGDPVLVDDTVTQALAGPLPAGAYAVLWRVTSADGHPVSGQLAFTASAAAGQTAAATPATPSQSAAGAAPEAAPSATSTLTATTTGASDGGSAGLPPWLVVLLVAAGGAALGGVVLALGRSHRRS